MRFGEAVEWRTRRVLIAEAMHWTLRYVDELTADDVADVQGVLDGRNKALRDMVR